MARRAKPQPLPPRQRVYMFLRLYEGMKANPYGSQQKITYRVTFGPKAGAEVLGVDRQDFESYLTRFRQLVSPGDAAFLGTLLPMVARHVADPELRQRLTKARAAWRAAQAVPSSAARESLGDFAAGPATARLYMYGVGIMHSDPALVTLWDRLSPGKRAEIEFAFHQYEAKVRRIANELHHVVRETEEGGHWREDPIDLGA